MTVQIFEGIFRGLSTDTKPTTVNNGSLFFETDTGKTFYRDNQISEWIEQTDEKKTQVLGVGTLFTAGDTLTIQNLKPRKYLTVFIFKINSGAARVDITFNNDSGTNYTTRTSTNGGADGTVVSQNEITLSVSDTNPNYLICEILNLKGQEKLLSMQQGIGRGTAGEANAPNRKEIVAKWANTVDKINRIDITNISAGDYDIGTTMIVLGRD